MASEPSQPTLPVLAEPDASAIPRPLPEPLRSTAGFIEGTGEMVLLLARALVAAVRPPYRVRNLFQILEFVGVGSLFIVLLTGVFTGMVFALQSERAYRVFNAQALIGGTVALSLFRELAPSLTALMVAGRVGSSITTELGTMRVTEQIDALVALAVDPIQYLVSPRVVALLVMVPALTMGFNAIGMVGAWFVCRTYLGVDDAGFWSRVDQWMEPLDVWCSLVKGAVFGLTIAVIACSKGFNATGGARGVGLATTQSVVYSSVAVLVIDYVITSIFFT